MSEYAWILISQQKEQAGGRKLQQSTTYNLYLFCRTYTLWVDVDEGVLVNRNSGREIVVYVEYGGSKEQ